MSETFTKDENMLLEQLRQLEAREEEIEKKKEQLRRLLKQLQIKDGDKEEQKNTQEEDFARENADGKEKKIKLEKLQKVKSREYLKNEETVKLYNKRTGCVTTAAVMYQVRMCTFLFLRFLNLGCDFSMCGNLKEAEDISHIVIKYTDKNENHDQKDGALFIQIRYFEKSAEKKLTFIQNKESDIALEKFFPTFCLLNSTVDPNHEILQSSLNNRVYIMWTNAEEINSDILEKELKFEYLKLVIPVKNQVLSVLREKIPLEYEKFCTSIEDLISLFPYSVEQYKKQVENDINALLQNAKSEDMVKIIKSVGTSFKDNKDNIPEKYKKMKLQYLDDFVSKFQIYYKIDESFLDNLIKDEIASALTISTSETETVYSHFIDNIKNWWEEDEAYILTQNSKHWTNIVKDTELARFKRRENEFSKLGINFCVESVKELQRKIEQGATIYTIISCGNSTLPTVLKLWQALQTEEERNFILVNVDDYSNDSEILWNTWPNWWCRTLAVQCNSSYDIKQVFETACNALAQDTSARAILIIPRYVTWNFHLSVGSDISYINIDDTLNFFQLDEQSQSKIFNKVVNFQGQLTYLNCILSEENISMLSADAITYLITDEIFQLGEDLTKIQLSEYVPRYLGMDSSVISEETFIQRDDLQSPAAIYGEAGMGKTTLLTHLALLQKKCNPNKWIVIVNLLNYCQYFDNSEKLSEKEIADIIIDSLKTNEVETQFVCQCLKNLKNFIILFDGVNEVCPYFSEKVINLLNYLNSKCFTTLITSRYDCKEFLEQELSIRSCYLKPMDKKRIQDYLLKIWKRESLLPEESLKNVMNRLLYQYSQSLIDPEFIFLSNPIHLNVFANLYKGKLEDFVPQKNKLKKCLVNILELFTEILNTKCEILFREKKSEDVSNPIVKTNMSRFLQEYTTFNKNICSLQIQNNENKITYLKANIMKEFQTLNLSTDELGIIKSVSHFVCDYTYKLYWDYFFALWLAENYKDHKDIVKQTLIKDDMKVVRMFVDLKLAQSCSLQTAIVLRNYEEVECLVSGKEMQVLDSMGRTGSHLAAAYNEFGLLQILSYDNDADLRAKDAVGWTPLRYAAATCSWQCVDYILGKLGIEKLQMEELYQDMEQCLEEIIHECNTKILKYLSEFIKNIQKKNVNRRNSNRTNMA